MSISIPQNAHLRLDDLFQLARNNSHDVVLRGVRADGSLVLGNRSLGGRIAAFFGAGVDREEQALISKLFAEKIGEHGLQPAAVKENNAGPLRNKQIFQFFSQLPPIGPAALEALRRGKAADQGPIERADKTLKGIEDAADTLHAWKAHLESHPDELRMHLSEFLIAQEQIPRQSPQHVSAQWGLVHIDSLMQDPQFKAALSSSLTSINQSDLKVLGAQLLGPRQASDSDGPIGAGNPSGRLTMGSYVQAALFETFHKLGSSPRLDQTTDYYRRGSPAVFHLLNSKLSDKDCLDRLGIGDVMHARDGLTLIHDESFLCEFEASLKDAVGNLERTKTALQTEATGTGAVEDGLSAGTPDSASIADASVELCLMRFASRRRNSIEAIEKEARHALDELDDALRESEEKDEEQALSEQITAAKVRYAEARQRFLEVSHREQVMLEQVGRETEQLVARINAERGVAASKLSQIQNEMPELMNAISALSEPVVQAKIQLGQASDALDKPGLSADAKQAATQRHQACKAALQTLQAQHRNLHARVNEGVALLKEVRLRVEYMDKALQDANAIFSAVTMRRGLIDEARTEAQRQAITSATQNDASTLAKEAHVVRNEPSALQKLSEHNRFKNEQGDIVLFFDNYAPRESELIAQLQKLRSVLSISSLD
jgi:hypothetical protein